MKITHTAQSEVTTPAVGLTVDNAKTFLSSLPRSAGSARVNVITRDLGDQREPTHVVVGLRVQWEDDGLRPSHTLRDSRDAPIQPR